MNLMTNELLAWINKLIRENRVDEFYNSRIWRKLSKEAMKRDKNECKHCKDKGIYKAAEQVHHIEELKLNPLRALDLLNLISLCKVCHNKVHDRFNKNDTLRTQNKFINEERW